MALAIVAISFAAITFRKAQPTHPLVASAIRLGLAATLLSPLAIRRLLRVPMSPTLLRVGLLAAVCYAAHFATWVWSLTLTSVAASVTLVTATPLMLALVARGADRPSRRLWFALVMASVGVMTIGGLDLLTSSDALLGDALALAGAASMAVYLHRARALGEGLDVVALQWMATLGASILLLCGALVIGVPIRAASTDALLWLVLSALVPQLIGHGLLTWALRHRGPTSVAMVTVGEPVGATILAAFLLGETVPPTTLLGCALTTVAVVLAMRG